MNNQLDWAPLSFECLDWHRCLTMNQFRLRSEDKGSCRVAFASFLAETKFEVYCRYHLVHRTPYTVVVEI